MDAIGERNWIPQTDSRIDNLGQKENWIPTFSYVEDIADSADLINLPHEDYPQRIPATQLAIERLYEFYERNMLVISITTYLVRQVHQIVFAEAPFAGVWRNVRVFIGQHTPPEPHLLNDLMVELHNESMAIRDERDLWRWYYRFEVIHPFQDGNGRVGGVFVAAISALLRERKGEETAYLSPVIWTGKS